MARQLVDGGVVDQVLVTDRSSKRAAQIVTALGSNAGIVAWPPNDVAIRGVDVVATALGDTGDLLIAEQCIRLGVAMVSASDHPDCIAGLGALNDRAIANRVTIAAGCGLSPGCSDVLAAHGSMLFDSVHEVKIARAGAAGKQSIAAVREQRRDVPAVWRHGRWQEMSRLVEHVWFAEPIGATECQVVRGGNDFLAKHLGARTDVTPLWAEVKAPPWLHRNDEGIGAIRVEVWGQRDGERDVIVYGLVDRVSNAAGALMGWVAEELSVANDVRPSGVHSVAALVDAQAAMRALIARGVVPAVFEGAPIS